MKVVITGGTGQVGQILREHYGVGDEHDVVVLSRGAGRGSRPREQFVRWDGTNLGDWAEAIEGADVVINLAGRTVNCRYTKANMDEMMRSRVDSTRVIGEAIAQAKVPPKLWLQMSTATIYAHRFDRSNDEATGKIGGSEPDVPDYWSFSIEIAKAWERELAEATVPNTRKVALRSAVVMSPHKGGPFDILRKLTRLGLGGSIAGGEQYVSWIHECDFVRIIDLLIERESIDGAINLAAPNPLPQREFMRELRQAEGVRIGLPATRLMAEIGAFFMRTDTELILKSRYVISSRLAKEGFAFDFPKWPAAAHDLCQRSANL